MRAIWIGLLFLGACTTEACTSEDPTTLDGTLLLSRRTDRSKAIRAGDDDDDDDDDDDAGSVASQAAPGANSATTTSKSASTVKETIEQQCFDIINKYRATKSLPALARWTDAENCSDLQSKNDSQSGQAHGSFGQCQENAQNECPGYPGSAEQNLPECLADMWAEGPGGGHYENMTSTAYTMASCGVFEVGDGTFWAVQNFR